MGLLRARYQIKSLLSDRIGSIVVLEVERLLLFLFFYFIILGGLLVTYRGMIALSAAIDELQASVRH